MKIINYQESGGGITADTTLITADNTFITADAGPVSSEGFLLIIPREFVDEVFVTMYNELTFATISFVALTTTEKRYMKFEVPVTGIKEADSFELTIRKDSFEGELIYRDKAYATTIQDLENYKLSYPNANGVIIL